IVEAIAAGEPPKKPKTSPRKQWSFKDIVAPIASLRLTVILFVLSFIVVLSGTLAQVDEGNWTAVEKYFRSAFAWIPLQIFFPRSFKVSGAIPFPGGWLLGGLLLMNLL